MGAVSNIRQDFNHYIIEGDKKVKKLVSTPAAIKKLFQTTMKAVALLDLARLGEVVQHKMTDAMDGSIKLIGFYYTYKNLMFWINPFTKESIDREKLKSSLQIFFNTHFHIQMNEPDSKKIADEVIEKVMSKGEYQNRDQVLTELKIAIRFSTTLKEKMKNSSSFNTLLSDDDRMKYIDSTLKQIDTSLMITQVKRTTAEIIANLSFTIADFGDNLLTLSDWGVKSLSTLARSFGQRIPVYGSRIVKFGAKNLLGTIYSVGFIFILGNTTIQIRKKYNKLKYNTALSKNEKDELNKEIENLKLDRLTAGVDLIATLPMLLCTVNPGIALALGIIAKGTGFVCIFLRK